VSDTVDNRRRPWYEADPERVAFELKQFEDSCLPVAHRLGRSDGSNGTRFVIQTSLPFKGKELPIDVVYPFDFPDEAPTVYGPGGLLDRHQARGGNFCLLEDPDGDWSPGWSGAQLVHIKLRALLEDTEAGREVIAAGEADMPEPVTAHMAYKPETVVLVPSPMWAEPLAESHGDIELVDGYYDGQLVLTAAEGIGRADVALIERMTVSRSDRHRGVWVALPDPVSTLGADLLASGIEQEPALLHRLKRQLTSNRKRRFAEGWVAFTFFEEGPRRGQHRRAWVFARVRLDRNGDSSVEHLARTNALTASERARRLPELHGLGQVGALVVGAGSLGSPVVFELAKAGIGQVDVVDNDFLDANNVVRHVLGTQWAGTSKARSVAAEARARNPFGQVVGHHFRVGGDQDDSDNLDRLIDQASVVIDTTGSQTVGRILDRRCREAGRRLVIAGLTAGSYGAEVLVLRPSGPCFLCFVFAQEDGVIPSPATGPRSAVTPVNCSHPAFAGAGFDATEAGALVSRTAIQATYASTYPALDFEWAIMNFRSAPRWQSGSLGRRADCPRCGTS
jgi:molybdopterin/thiamine biosynthesis adenylyltransferase